MVTFCGCAISQIRKKGLISHFRSCRKFCLSLEAVQLIMLLSRSFKDSWIWFLTCLLDGGNGHLLSRSLTTDFVWGAFMLTPTSCARSKALKDAMHKDKEFENQMAAFEAIYRCHCTCFASEA
ncbi:hypothetical protein CMV_006553 [Castanea mollissima]|uniref:Uncharacterized protein n=1 Tax=Castanea mollissima TaxID=60419 RepID=A0A8J4RVE7_9ROSI|nr:hypothetical protein CMV_006553 [Castanea mollissima]